MKPPAVVGATTGAADTTTGDVPVASACGFGKSVLASPPVPLSAAASAVAPWVARPPPAALPAPVSRPPRVWTAAPRHPVSRFPPRAPSDRAPQAPHCPASRQEPPTAESEPPVEARSPPPAAAPVANQAPPRSGSPALLAPDDLHHAVAHEIVNRQQQHRRQRHPRDERRARDRKALDNLVRPQPKQQHVQGQ